MANMTRKDSGAQAKVAKHRVHASAAEQEIQRFGSRKDNTYTAREKVKHGARNVMVFDS